MLSDQTLVQICCIFPTMLFGLLWAFGYKPQNAVGNSIKQTAKHLHDTGNAEIDRRRAEERRKEEAIQRQLKAYEESKRNRSE